MIYAERLVLYVIIVIVSRAGSGMCELTNQSRLSIWKGGLKETGAITERFRGGKQCYTAEQYE